MRTRRCRGDGRPALPSGQALERVDLIEHLLEARVPGALDVGGRVFCQDVLDVGHGDPGVLEGLGPRRRWHRSVGCWARRGSTSRSRGLVGASPLPPAMGLSSGWCPSALRISAMSACRWAQSLASAKPVKVPSVLAGPDPSSVLGPVAVLEVDPPLLGDEDAAATPA